MGGTLGMVKPWSASLRRWRLHKGWKELGEGALWASWEEFQAEATASAKAQGWECAWPAGGVWRKPVGLEWRLQEPEG